MDTSAETDTGGEKVRSYSDWMSQLPAELHNIPLSDLAIPGSHDSMTYDLDVRSSIIEPDNLKGLSKCHCARRTVRKWAVTQEESITKQLDAGVRYLDLRIARKENDTDPNRLYFYHGLCTRTDVESILRAINEWAGNHPKEILLLSFSHFRGFGEETKERLHAHLIHSIKTLFGDKLLQRAWKIPSLRSCWDQGRSVIVSYDYPANQHREIWDKISYFYGDSMNPAEVTSKLRNILDNRRPMRTFFVCGLNLTLPEDARILKYILRPRDDFTKVLGRNQATMLEWVKQQGGRRFNIVAADVVTRDDFVPTVVQLNISQ